MRFEWFVAKRYLRSPYRPAVLRLVTAFSVLGVAAGVATSRGRVPVIAGAGGNATSEALALTKASEDAGADALLHVTPYYNRPSQEGLFRHFEAIARATKLPIVLYNVPTRTACDLLDRDRRAAVRVRQHRRAVARYQLALQQVKGMDPAEGVTLLLANIPALYPPKIPKNPTS